MTTTVKIYVEPAHETKPCLVALAPFASADTGEVELRFECNLTPYDPGRSDGPPEHCYPPEGGEVEILSVCMVRGKTEIALLADCATELEEYFQEQVEELAIQLAADADDAAREAAAEARYEDSRDRWG